MKTLRALYQLARADFLQRTRSYGFLITLAVTLYGAYFLIPPNHSSYATMEIGGHRGLYNSAYLGSLMAVLISPFLSLAGFYLVKNAIDRDIQTGVGQILATTPLTKPLYIIGKTISNFAVLSVMVAVIAAVTAVMQFVRNEDLSLQLGPLLKPFIFISLPVMFVVASLAILFESVRWLRGGFGNVVYFFLWAAALSAPIARDSVRHGASNDLFGMGVIVPSITAAAEAAFPGTNQTSLSVGINVKNAGEYWDLTTFRWDGLDWTRDVIAARFGWMAVGLGLALLAAIFFRRFDPAREGSKRKGEVVIELPQPNELGDRVDQDQRHPIPLHRLTKRARFSFPFMVAAELRLALHGVSLWWYGVAVVLFAGGLFAPLPVSRAFLVAAWIWPLLIWSQMGTRETRLRTDQMIFSTPHLLRRQLPACWFAGVLIAVVTGGGTGFHLLLAGEKLGFIAWIIGAVFIPTMALALGVWSGSSKLFEVLYLLLWYLGPANHLGAIDFMGATGALLSPNTPRLFCIMTIALALLAVGGRKRQLTN